MKPLSTFVFTSIVTELDKLEGSHVEKIHQIGPETFRFAFSGKKDLVMEIGVRLNLTNYKTTSPEKPSQVTLILRKYLGNKKLLKISQNKRDRIAVFDFGACDISRGLTCKLVGEFFSHGNLILTDENSKILFCFRPEEWKDRKIAKGGKYEFPKNTIPPIKEDYSPMTKEFVSRFKNMNEAVDEFFAKQKTENPKLKKLKTRLEIQQKTLVEMEKQVAELKEKGDLILNNYEIVEKSKEGKRGKLTLVLE